MKDRKDRGFFGRIKNRAKEKKAQELVKKQSEKEAEKKENNKIYYVAGAIGLIGTIIILYKTRKK